MKCARHPRVDTLLTCVTCGTPICPDCMVETPVGMKCPDCARSPVPAVFRVSPERLALAMTVSVVAGAATGALALAIRFGLLLVLLAPVAGALAAEAASRAAGGKRGQTLALAAAASFGIGAILLAPQVLAAAFAGVPLDWRELLVLLERRPFFIFFAGLAAFIVYWRVR